MVTAYPTTSPVNGSAAGPSLLDTLGVTSGSSTATILGAVAVGVLGIVLIAGAVYYFRSGGTVDGLVKKFNENKDTIKKVTGSVADLLPLSEEQKKKIDSAIDNPSSVVPPQLVGKVEEYKKQVIDALPIRQDQKEKLTVSVKRIESTPIGTQLKALVPPPPQLITEPITEPKPEPKPEPITEPITEPKPEPKPEPALVAVHINTEDLESVREFLASKHTGTV